jgi:ATP-dependent protease ClpP protease subunit
MLRYVLIFLYSVLFGFLVGRTIFAEELRLNSLNTVTFRGAVSAESTTEVLVKLHAAVGTRGSKNYPIYLVLDSPGGGVQSGLSFIDAVKPIKNLRTVTIFAASMASAIVQAIDGSRLITPAGLMMFHRAAGTVSGQFETGELESQLQLAKEMVRRMERINASRLGITLEAYKAKVVNEYWLLAEQAIADKAADKVVDISCSQELVDRRETGQECSFFGCVDVTYSACPSLRFPLSVKAASF